MPLFARAARAACPDNARFLTTDHRESCSRWLSSLLPGPLFASEANRRRFSDTLNNPAGPALALLAPLFQPITARIVADGKKRDLIAGVESALEDNRPSTPATGSRGKPAHPEDRAQTWPLNALDATMPCVNHPNFLTKGVTMFRSIHAGFLAAIAGAVPMPHIVTAWAQDVQMHCARAGVDGRVRPIPAILVPRARRVFGLSPDTPSAFVRKSTSFRCMKGKVWAL